MDIGQSRCCQLRVVMQMQQEKTYRVSEIRLKRTQDKDRRCSRRNFNDKGR
jgi:hypothetical protein